MSYWLSEAAATLRSQVDARWPKRDKASDGWIGDASHAAVVSDHNPCWTCAGDHYGVVRAIDLDSDLDKTDPRAMEKFTDDLIAYARKDQDHRLKYVIYNHRIASGTYADQFWTWRPYDGTDPHTNHAHVSFEAAGDLHGRKFALPILTESQPSVPREALRRLRSRVARARRRLAGLVRRLRHLSK